MLWLQMKRYEGSRGTRWRGVYNLTVLQPGERKFLPTPPLFSPSPIETTVLLDHPARRLFSTMENNLKQVVTGDSHVPQQQPEHTDFLLARALSPEDRIITEKKLKRKLDARCSLFVLIYILSEYLEFDQTLVFGSLANRQTTLTETTSVLLDSRVCKPILT